MATQVSVVDKAKEYAKAVVAFFTVLAPFLIALFANADFARVFGDNTLIGVVSGLALAVGAATGVGVVPNKLQPKQIEKAVREVGNDVVKQALERAAEDIPRPARDQVLAHVDRAQDIVERVLSRR